MRIKLINAWRFMLLYYKNIGREYKGVLHDLHGELVNFLTALITILWGIIWIIFMPVVPILKVVYYWKDIRSDKAYKEDQQ